MARTAGGLMSEGSAAPRRIVHVAARYPPALGGMEKVVQYLARSQHRRGAAVRVITSDPWDAEALGVPFTPDFAGALPSTGKIAVAGKEIMQQRFTNAEQISATYAIEELRRVKTEDELTRIRREAPADLFYILNKRIATLCEIDELIEAGKSGGQYYCIADRGLLVDPTHGIV